MARFREEIALVDADALSEECDEAGVALPVSFHPGSAALAATDAGAGEPATFVGRT